VPRKRINDSALSVLERPVLAWMAERVPLRLGPDHLTLIGLAGALITAAGYFASRWSIQWLWVASLGIIINWAGDSLDGTLARLRRIERLRYGFFVDHTSDLFAQSLVFLALGLSPCARFDIACLGLIAFLMVFVYSLICVEVRHTLRITYFGFGPTEIRALLIVGNLITIHSGVVNVAGWFTPHGWVMPPLTLHELAILVLFVITVLALTMLALRERAELAHEDPPRTSAPSGATAAQ
jgi:archaetidylinositol phosphate synthase